MMRRTLCLGFAAFLVAACARGAARGPGPGPLPGEVYYGPQVEATLGASGFHTAAELGEGTLENLPWHPAVMRADLSATGPVALVQVYRMAADALAVDATGRVFCLSARDLTPRWISTLRAPLSAAPAENATHYVFLEVDPRGAAWLQWFSKRSGAEAMGSPARLPYSPSSGVSATVSTAYVGSLGSPIDNKTVESINLADGSPGWGWRIPSRVVATPTVDPGQTTLLVLGENRSVTALPASPAGEPPLAPQWEAVTLGANVADPAITRDWAFVASEDNFLRCYDVHGGMVRWTRGTDAPNRKAPWVLGAETARTVSAGGEGSGTVKVESFTGYVFVRNELGLHCFDADTGTPVFRDATGDRPLVKVGEWVVTLDRARVAVLRRGANLAAVTAAPLDVFDFVPTNSFDGSILVATKEGVVLLAVPH
jgi:outer membrane protein assembly factor BamB